MKNHNRINFAENEITFEISTKIYPKDVIYKTCYVFIDRAFIYLDIANKNSMAVSLKGKKHLSKKQLEKIKDEFSNELRNVFLRENVIKRNQKVLEYIISGAITASMSINIEKKGELSDLDKEIEELKNELKEIEENDFENDPLGIKEIVVPIKKANSKI